MKPNEARSDVELAVSRLREHVTDPDASSASVAARRRRFVETATRAPRRGQGIAVMVVAACALALVVGLSLRHLGPVAGAPLTFTAGRDQTQGELGAYFASPSGTELPLRFSDGSTMMLEGSARARVTATTALGATVLLETGRANVEVVHRPRADWKITSGPYTIRVTGTSFGVSWEPSSGTLEVTMYSGTVVVRGPGIESGVEVTGPHRFVTSSAPKVEVVPDPSASPTELVAPDFGSTPDLRHGAENDGVKAPPLQARSKPNERSMSSVPSAVGDTSEPSPESWSALAAKGQHQRVLDAADGRGIDTVLGSATEADLSALADAARYGGRTDLARRALLAIRSRFAGSSKAESAAFLIGRMMDDAGSARAAVEWYDRYLAEASRGAFAAEALGRRMVALRHLGEVEACRTAARDYLRRFPSGPYAGVASEIAEP